MIALAIAVLVALDLSAWIADRQDNAGLNDLRAEAAVSVSPDGSSTISLILTGLSAARSGRLAGVDGPYDLVDGFFTRGRGSPQLVDEVARVGTTRAYEIADLPLQGGEIVLAPSGRRSR